MDNSYRIEMGNFREDYTIFYSELNGDRPIRKLSAQIDFSTGIARYLPIFKKTVILYVDSFKNWDATRNELTLFEYTEVLKRIYDFLQSNGYKVVLQ